MQLLNDSGGLSYLLGLNISVTMCSIFETVELKQNYISKSDKWKYNIVVI